MSSTNPEPTSRRTPLITADRLRAGGGFLGVRRQELKMPTVLPGTTDLLTACRWVKPAERQRLTLPEFDKGWLDPWVIRIGALPWVQAITIPAVKNDAKRHSHDLVLEVAWRIERAASFFDNLAVDLLSPESPLTADDVLSAVISRVEPQVRQELSSDQFTLEDLRDRDVRPASWWSARLSDWLASIGMSGSVVRVSYPSAEAAAARERQIREQQQRELDEQRQQQREREHLEALASARFARDLEAAEKEREALEADRQVDQARRELRLKQLAAQEEAIKQRAARQQIEAELAQRESAMRLAQLRARHDQDLAESRARAATEQAKATQSAELNAALVEQAKAETERARKAAEQSDQLTDNLAAFRQNMEQMIGDVMSLVKDLLSKDATKVYNAVGTLTQQAGVSAESIGAMGVELTAQTLVDAWSAHAVRQNHPIRLAKHELTTRDIGFSRMNVLRIGQTLNFRITTARSGYITVLNLGTSGAFWLLCPGSLCNPMWAKVQAGQTYDLPGPGLLPFDGRLVEQGPAGWEHLVAIVSNRPLFPSLPADQPSSPIVRIQAAKLQELSDQLQREPETWSVGILSFHVE